MTNAEKLAKDTDFLAKILVEWDCAGVDCDYCKFRDNPDCGNHEKTKEWLESEVEEDAEVH